MKRPIIHISESLGGVEIYILLLLRFLDYSDRKVIIVVPEGKSFEKYIGKVNGKIITLPMTREISPVNDLKHLFQLRSIIKSYNNPIVHLHSSKAGALGRLASWGLKEVTVIHTPHAYFYLSKTGWKRRVFLSIEKILKPFTDYVVTTSPSESNRSQNDVGFKLDKIITLTNSIDIEKLNSYQVTSEVRDNISDTRGANRVVMIARISYQKNVEMFLDVVSRLKSDKRIRFQLIGIGYYEDDRKTMNTMLENRGIEEGDLEIIPWVKQEELFKILAKTKVFVLTSRYESFGYVVAEAAALGVPSVATNVDGIKDIIKHGETGYLTEVGEVDTMADWIRALINDKNLYEKMSDAAYNRVVNKFNMKINSRNFEEFYTKLDQLDE